MKGCIFCRIASKEEAASIVLEDESVVVFRDARPQAPVHLLVIPRRHVVSLADAREEDGGLLARLLLASAGAAAREGLRADGYRVVTNVGVAGGQSVYHLHFHVLGGRALRWPPG